MKDKYKNHEFSLECLERALESAKVFEEAGRVPAGGDYIVGGHW